MNQDNGGPAFPGPVMKPLENYYPGLTMRDYFAAQMLSSVFSAQSRNQPDLKAIANAAYKMADAMLEARK